MAKESNNAAQSFDIQEISADSIGKIEIIDLGDLAQKNFRGCNATMASLMIESASVCFCKHSAKNPMKFSVIGDFTQDFLLKYIGVNDAMLATHNDSEEAVEKGAYCIAFSLIERFTGLRPLLKSAKGNGFDYHMGHETQDGFLNFSPKARLEVSGIFKETKANSVDKRFQEKLNRLSEYRDSSPAYIVVVVYNKPMAKVGVFNV